MVWVKVGETVRGYDNGNWMAEWQCGSVAEWQCGSVAEWQWGSGVGWQLDGKVAVWQGRITWFHASIQENRTGVTLFYQDDADSSLCYGSCVMFCCLAGIEGEVDLEQGSRLRTMVVIKWKKRVYMEFGFGTFDIGTYLRFKTHMLLLHNVML